MPVGKFKANVGDVFAVPIDDSRVGVGQVVAVQGKSAEYFAIFDITARDPESIDIDRALESRVMFLALSNDAKLAAGHWTIVGNRPVASTIPLPAWRIRIVDFDEERVDVVDYSGTRRRPASEAEADLLSNERLFSPKVVEDAVQAKHGLKPWQERYSEMAPNELPTTARIFGPEPEGSLEPISAVKGDDEAYEPDSEHGVFVYFALGSEGFGSAAQREVFFHAEEVLEAELEKSGLGEIDGNEIGEGHP